MCSGIGRSQFLCTASESLPPWLTLATYTCCPSSALQLRILEAKPRAPSGRSLRQVAAGWLLQDADSLHPSQVKRPQQAQQEQQGWLVG